MSEVANPSDAEAEAVLTSLAHKKSGRFDERTLTRHVLDVTRGCSWPVRRAAMEALLTRVASARALVVDRKRSRDGAIVTKDERGTRPYRCERYGDFIGSCSCPDFRNSALGLCKHLLAGVDAGIAPRARPVVTWDPVRPVIGAGDSLARLRDRGRPVVLPQLARARVAALDGLLAATSEPAAHALLVAERARIQSRAPVHASVCERALSCLRVPLYPYQHEGVRRFLENGRLLLADDMGLGKTAQAIAACHVLWQSGAIVRGLIIVPAPLKPQWAREWRMFSDAPVHILEGTPVERRAMLANQSLPFLIANYEQLLRDVDAMAAMQPGIVVLDEAQRVKNWDTRTARALEQLSPPYRLALTGTPMENRLSELAAVASFVDAEALEPRWRLDAVHSRRADGERAVVGAQNLATVRERIAPFFVRRLRADVLGDLPARTDREVLVPFTQEQSDRHDELRPVISRLLAIAKRRPLTRPEHLRLMSALTAQRIICNGLAQADFVEVWPALSRRKPTDEALTAMHTPKLAAVRDVLRKLVVDEGKKVVVFSQWRRMLELLSWTCAPMLAAAGARAAFFSGHEGQKRRTHNLVDFHDDPKMRVLFATDAGGVGLNLQRAASACVLVDVPWNPAVLEQRVGRVHRNGQMREVDVIHVVTSGGIEARVRELVGNKRALFTGLFDGTSDAIAFANDGTFLSRLESIVDGAPVEPRPASAPAPVAPAAAPVVDAHALFAAIKAQRDSSGALTITAPPESAQLLAHMFASMATLLSAAA